MLEIFGMLKYKLRLIPLPVGILLFLNDGLEIKGKKEEMKNIPYYEA